MSALDILAYSGALLALVLAVCLGIIISATVVRVSYNLIRYGNGAGRTRPTKLNRD
jgi:uncharacterized membrane protein